MKFTVWLLLLVIVLFAQPARAARPSFKERFGSVKWWDFHYVYSSSSPHRWNEGGITYDRSALEMNQSGRVRMTAKLNGGDFVQVEGIGRGSANFNKSFLRRDLTTTDTRYDRGSGSPQARVRVDFQLDKGVYHLNIQPGDFTITYGGKRVSQNGTHEYGPHEGGYSVQMITLPEADGKQALRLPESGAIISGSYTWEQQIARMRAGTPDFDEDEWNKRYAKQGTLRWVMVPADPLDVELLVEPKDYDNWMPEGGRDESVAGNTMEVKATLVAKGGSGPPSILARTMTFHLMDTSHQPGVALNLPLKDAKETPDLAFEQAKNDGYAIADEGLGATTPAGAYAEAKATLSSFDWGSFGTLLVTAELANGRTVVGRLKTGPTTNIRLPKRGPDSRIADKWKAAVEFSGDDTEDKDEQAGNQNLGDGLTAYEEYRGLIARGQHSRPAGLLVPKTKQVVVENQVGEAVRPGLALFKKASAIVPVELDKGELPESRQVNLNFNSAHGGDQFGLRVIAGALNGNSGENQPAGLLGKTPKVSERVVIDVAFAASSYTAQAAAVAGGGGKMPYTQAEDLDNTVAHEVAHGVYTAHHGPDSPYRSIRELNERTRDYHAIGEDGDEKLAANEPGGKFALTGAIGLGGTESSGDVGCIMAYTSMYQWAAVGPSGGPYTFYAIGLQPVGKHFCTSAAPTGFNLPHKLPNGKEVPGFFGPATSVNGTLPAGNCLGQMKVKDW